MAKNSKYYKLHIFSPGTHTSASGHKVTISEEDLLNTANIFISNHRVPLCLGHSSFKHNDVVPSLGWFRDVKVDDNGNLYGLVEATPAGQNLLENGYYENFSASFYSPDSDLNPKPGKCTLRHVAALGGEPPSLKELDPMLEVLPEDFSEIQNFNQWYEFKEVDRFNFEEFSTSTKLLPDNYNFKGFRKYSGKLRCKTGLKQCGGRCIPQNWECKVDGTSKSEDNKYQKKSKFGNKLKKSSSDFKKTFAPSKEENTWKSKEDWKAEKDKEKENKKNEKVERNLTTGNLKALAAVGITVGVSLLRDSKSFPDNKAAKHSADILGTVVANQFLMINDATPEQRAINAAYSLLEGSLEVGIKEKLSGNAYANSMAKASTGLLSTMLIDSDLIDLGYDGYAKKMYSAINTLHGAVKDAKSWKQKSNFEADEHKKRLQEMNQILEENRKVTANASGVNQEYVDDLATSIRKEVKAAQDVANKARQKAGANKDLAQLFEFLLRNEPDAPNWMEKMSILQGYINENKQHAVNLSETIKYPNSDVPLTFSMSEISAGLLPFVLSLMKDYGMYTDTDVKKAFSKPVKSGTPKLDAVFSELKKAKGILRHEVSNSDLEEALFGPKRLSDDFDESERDFSENNRKNRRKRRRNNDADFAEERKSFRTPSNKLLIDHILDDALSQAEMEFSEGKQGKKSKSRKRTRAPEKSRTQNFHERKRKRRTSQKQMDFKESQEYQNLNSQIQKLERDKKRLQVENFAENLYRDGSLTEGIAKKRDLINFMMGLEDSQSNFDFGESDSVNPISFMENLLSNIEPMVSFSEVTSHEMIPMPKFEEGYDRDSQKLNYQINLLMEANPNLTLEKAWAKVAGGRI